MHLPVPPKDDDAKKLPPGLAEDRLGEEPDEGDAEPADSPTADDEEGADEPPPDPAEQQRAAERAGDAEVPDYDGPYASAEERQNLGRDRALRAKLVSTARTRGLMEDEVEDVLQETLLAASRAEKLPAGSGETRDKYVFGILGHKIDDHWSAKYRNKKLAERAKVRFAPPVLAVDTVAERDLFDKLPTLVKPGQRADLLLLIRHKVDKVPLSNLAREQGEDYEAFAKRIRRLWVFVRAQVVMMGVGVAALIAVFWPRPRHPLGLDDPGQVALLEPAVSTHVGEIDPLDWAKVRRGEAFRACMNDQWWECLQALDAARELDPSGETDPVVIAARKDATDGYMAGLKPGSTWRPPVVRAYASRAAR